jgi:hypothetical protein
VNTSRATRWAVGLAAGGALALLVLLLWPPLTGRVYASFDFYQQFIPFRVFARLARDAGEWGLWCPVECRGFELHAEGQAGLFNPFHLLLYRELPLTWALGLEFGLYFPLTWLGTWLLLRGRWAVSPAVAATGASLYTFCPFFLAHFGHIHNNWQLMHVPWLACLAWGCLAAEQRAAYATFIGPVYASVILLGHPQFTWLVSVLVALVALSEGVAQGWRPAYWRGVAWLATGIAAGILLGMIQLVPTLEQLAQVPRGTLSAVERNNYSLHPVHLLQNLSPRTFAEVTLGDWIYRSASERSYLNNRSEFAAYCGLGLLTLAWAALVLHGRAWWRSRARGQLLVLGGAGVVAGWLMLGQYGGLYALLAHVPVLNQMRCPARYIIVVQTLLCALAIAGLHAGSAQPPRRLTRREWALLLLPAALSLVGALVALGVGRFGFREQTIAFAGAGLLLGPLVAAGTAALVAWRVAGQPLATGCIALLCLADVTVNGLSHVHTGDYRSWAEVQAMYRGLAEASPHRWRTGDVSLRPVWQGQYIPHGYMAIKPPELLALEGRISRLNHVRVAAINLVWVGDTLRQVRDPLPRFRLVPELRHSADPLAELDTTEPAVVALCRPADAPALNGPPLDRLDHVGGVYDGFDRQTFLVGASAPRLLVIADRWTPDWRATVDDRPVPLIRLYDGALRGVFVPAGLSEVKLTYEPASFRRGAQLTGLGLLLTLALMALTAWHQTRGLRR